MDSSLRSLLIRYPVLLLLGLFNLGLWYAVFSPLTIWVVYGLLRIVDPSVQLLGTNIIVFKGVYAAIVNACVAGSAYYLLTIFNVTTPMQARVRVKNLLFLLGSFFILNTARIFVFVLLASTGFVFFDVTHLFFWYFGSSALVVGLWFVGVKIFSIKAIPVYSDVRWVVYRMRRRR